LDESNGSGTCHSKQYLQIAVNKFTCASISWRRTWGLSLQGMPSSLVIFKFFSKVKIIYFGSHFPISIIKYLLCFIVPDDRLVRRCRVKILEIIFLIFTTPLLLCIHGGRLVVWHFVDESGLFLLPWSACWHLSFSLPLSPPEPKLPRPP
jgi:hypothetical protein